MFQRTLFNFVSPIWAVPVCCLVALAFTATAPAQESIRAGGRLVNEDAILAPRVRNGEPLVSVAYSPAETAVEFRLELVKVPSSDGIFMADLLEGEPTETESAASRRKRLDDYRSSLADYLEDFLVEFAQLELETVTTRANVGSQRVALAIRRCSIAGVEIFPDSVGGQFKFRSPGPDERLVALTAIVRVPLSPDSGVASVSAAIGEAALQFTSPRSGRVVLPTRSLPGQSGASRGARGWLRIARRSADPLPAGYRAGTFGRTESKRGLLPSIVSRSAYVSLDLDRIDAGPKLVSDPKEEGAPGANQLNLAAMTLTLAYLRGVPALEGMGLNSLSVAGVDVKPLQERVRRSDKLLVVDLRGLDEIAWAVGTAETVDVVAVFENGSQAETKATAFPSWRRELAIDLSLAALTDQPTAGGDDGAAFSLHYVEPDIRVIAEGSNAEVVESWFGVDLKLLQHNDPANVLRFFRSQSFADASNSAGTDSTVFGWRAQGESTFGRNSGTNLLGGVAWTFLSFDDQRRNMAPWLDLGVLVGTEVGDNEVDPGSDAYAQAGARFDRSYRLGNLFSTAAASPSDIFVRLFAYGYHDTRLDLTDGIVTLELLQGSLDERQVFASFTTGRQQVTLEDVGEVVEFGLRSSF